MIIQKRALLCYFSIFFIFACLLHFSLWSSIFDALEQNSTMEEIALTGLHKLNTEERTHLEMLLFNKSVTYPSMISKVDDVTQLRWVYEAHPFTGTDKPTLEDHQLYDENEMIYDIAICAMFQNEAEWLEEWIEYHKLIGIDHFYLYNNLSNDGYLEILEPYIIRGEVELIQWPVTTFPPLSQKFVYQNAIERAKGRARWLAIMDTDEFIVPVQHWTLKEALKEYENYGGITINWQMYGTSGLTSIPNEMLMIEALTYKAPRTHSENIFVKSIVKPHRVLHIGDPHYCVYKSDYKVVDTSHNLPYRSHNRRIPIDKIRMNHYWYRTEDYYNCIKVPRRIRYEGKPRDPELVKKHMDLLNSEKDTVIHKFVPELKKRMSLLRKN